MWGAWFAGFAVGLVVIVAPMLFVLLTMLTIGPFLAPLVLAWIVFMGRRAYRGSQPTPH
jgi:hypothetical protein